MKAGRWWVCFTTWVVWGVTPIDPRQAEGPCESLKAHDDCERSHIDKSAHEWNISQLLCPWKYIHEHFKWECQTIVYIESIEYVCSIHNSEGIECDCQTTVYTLNKELEEQPVFHLMTWTWCRANNSYHQHTDDNL